MHRTLSAACSLLCLIAASACGRTTPEPQAVPTPTPTVAAPPASAAAVPDSAARQKLQQRLDAMAQAYNKGDVEAARKALWSNHAVVRPNGDALDREQLLAQWQKDWSSLKNRKMTLNVVEVTKRDRTIEARWTMELTADVVDAQGAAHAYRLAGTQGARYVQNADEELLDGPITFTDSTVTMDGAPWTPPG